MTSDQTAFQAPVVLVSSPARLVRGKEHTMVNAALGAVESGQTVHLDMSSVEAIDAAGIGALLMLRHCAERAHGTFEIVSPSARVLDLLRLTQLESVLLAPDLRRNSDQLAAA